MTETARLPPIYTLISLPPDDEPLKEACSMAAAGADPATILCTDRTDMLDCALILQPESDLKDSQRVMYVAMLGLGDALGSVVPAGIDVTYQWPNRIDANMGAVGRVGLSVPSQTSGATIPPWLVLHVVVAVSAQGMNGIEDFGFETTLADEGALEVTAGLLLESFSRHFLTWMGRWQDDGFSPVREMWLRHAATHGQDIEVEVGRRVTKGRFTDIDDDGALILEEGETTHRVSLDAFLGG